MHTSVRVTSDGRGHLEVSATPARSTDGAGGQDRHNELDAREVRERVVGIVERASYMHERLTSKMVTYPASSDAFSDASLEAWRTTAAKGDDADFTRRLALDGLDPCSARRAVGMLRMAPNSTLPEWARLVERYIHALRNADRSAAAGGDPTPFVQLFIPFVEIVERDREHKVADALRHVSRAARQRLRTALLGRLARSAAPILQERFESYLASRATDPARSWKTERIDPVDGAPVSGAYLDYVGEMLDGGMSRLLVELPVLARIMATTALLWRDASAQFLLRLEADRAAIAEFLAGGSEPGLLVDIDAGLSDAHSGGHTVHILTFASGLRLVYKPRPLGVDAAFEALLHWAAERGAPLPTRNTATLAPRVLDRGGYGWAEYVEHAACADPLAVRRYYENAGSLLALLHGLGSTDCHYENIVACGDRPVIVDLETVLQPEIERAEPPLDRARNLGARLLYDESVLRTGMLPAWQGAGGDSAYDTGGFSATAGQTTPFGAVRWRAINTDAMQLERLRATIGTHPNLPTLEGRPVSPAQHVDDIVLGFGRMYEWLSAHRDALLAPGGPVARLARERVRFIARPSSVYDHVLRRSLRKGVLHDGAAREIELELLARGLLPLSRELWPLLEVEKQSLAQLDIPLFTIPGDATVMALGDRSIHLARSGLDVARSRIQSLGPEGLERQRRIIRTAFALRYFYERDGTRARHPAPWPEENALDTPPLTRGEIIAAAMELAAGIERLALVDCRGDPAWITTEPISSAGHARLQATGYGLYDGLAGIALFLAAAARCSDDPRITRLARRTLSPLRERLRSAVPAYVDEYGVGGARGIASIVYSLLRCGISLQDDAVIDDAVHAARQLTPEQIERDTSFDVLYGGAGVILALLALHKVRRSDELLELAHRCGRHLLSRRQPTPGRDGTIHHAWPTVGGRVHVGFAHGSAGIALALLRLHVATGLTDYLDAALDAIRHEDSLARGSRGESPVSPAAPDIPLAVRDRAAPPTNWCRGTAGIGLARLSCAAGSHATELRASAERAVQDVVRSTGPAAAPLDGACCGITGGVELLLAAGLRWGDAGLLSAAHRRASYMVRRSRAAGAYRLSVSPGAQIYDPSLYRGTAGIGYGLLRLCHPELLPSFLSWE
ncbi:MAG TPA: type 2 lanthipeptide synthetase LanM family protein [Gemmatimonadaceae bacterium]|nr:type 2 lanthipeptide synthetase LanM family protein [Gemmatimonadaceae bacterium]